MARREIGVDEAVGMHGFTPVAIAALMHIAEALRDRGSVRMTADGDDFGRRVLEFADALDRHVEGAPRPRRVVR